MPKPAHVLHKLKSLNPICEGTKYLINRNPRNLERMRIGYKPSGYHLENPGRSFWHKLELIPSGRYVTAKIIHYDFGPIIEASTSEWAIKKQLYKTNDTSAYVNLARVLSQRCLEAGLTEMLNTIKPTVPDGKLDKFIKTFEAGGISLTEPERFFPIDKYNKKKPEKPWEVTDDE